MMKYPFKVLFLGQRFLWSQTYLTPLWTKSACQRQNKCLETWCRIPIISRVISAPRFMNINAGLPILPLWFFWFIHRHIKNQDTHPSCQDVDSWPSSWALTILMTRVVVYLPVPWRMLLCALSVSTVILSPLAPEPRSSLSFFQVTLRLTLVSATTSHSILTWSHHDDNDNDDDSDDWPHCRWSLSCHWAPSRWWPRSWQSAGPLRWPRPGYAPHTGICREDLVRRKGKYCPTFTCHLHWLIQYKTPLKILSQELYKGPPWWWQRKLHMQMDISMAVMSCYWFVNI